MQQIYRRTAIKFRSYFIEITLRYGYSPVHLLHIFRTHFLRNTSGQLLEKKILEIWKSAHKKKNPLIVKKTLQACTAILRIFSIKIFHSVHSYLLVQFLTKETFNGQFYSKSVRCNVFPKSQWHQGKVLRMIYKS